MGQRLVGQRLLQEQSVAEPEGTGTRGLQSVAGRLVAQQAGVPPFRESELQPTGAPPEPLQWVSVRENSVVFGPLTRGSWLGVRRTLRFPAPTKKRAIRAV